MVEIKREKEVKRNKLWQEYFSSIEPFWQDYIKANSDNPPDGEKIKEKYKAYIDAEKKESEILRSKLKKINQ